MGAVVAICLSLFAISPALAGDDARRADLQAAVRTLGFIDGVTHGGVVIVAVVYGTDSPAAKAQATQTAQEIAGIPGPNNLHLQAFAVSAAELAQAASHADAAVLMASAHAQAGAITNAARQRRLVTIASDPACLEVKDCVLMVRAGDRVQIVLDTALASAVGANFSPVFMMMVQRR